MTRSHALAACSAALTLTLACGGSQTTSGDPDKGRQAFVDLRCNSCHEVAGESLPAPSVTPAVGLGGRALLPPSADRLKADILLPSSHFAVGYPREQIMRGDVSRMPDYSKQLSDEQVANLVAFLKSRYERGMPSATR
jgi:mono/diheme cytochrome c family protein